MAEDEATARNIQKLIDAFMAKLEPIMDKKIEAFIQEMRSSRGKGLSKSPILDDRDKSSSTRERNRSSRDMVGSGRARISNGRVKEVFDRGRFTGDLRSKNQGQQLQSRKQKNNEDIKKCRQELFKAMEAIQKEKRATHQYGANKERLMGLENQKPELDQPLPIPNEPIVHKENVESNTIEDKEVSDLIADHNSEKVLLTRTELLEAKCTLPSLQSDFELEKLTPLEPEKPSSVVSFSGEIQRSLPMVNELEQSSYLEPEHVLMPFPCEYPTKHCKELDLGHGVVHNPSFCWKEDYENRRAIMQQGWTPQILIRARDIEFEHEQISFFVLKEKYKSDYTDITLWSLSKKLTAGRETSWKRARRIQRWEKDQRYKPPDWDQNKLQNFGFFFLIKEEPPDARNNSDLRSNPFQVGGDDMIMGSSTQVLQHNSTSNSSQPQLMQNTTPDPLTRPTSIRVQL